MMQAFAHDLNPPLAEDEHLPLLTDIVDPATLALAQDDPATLRQRLLEEMEQALRGALDEAYARLRDQLEARLAELWPVSAATTAGFGAEATTPMAEDSPAASLEEATVEAHAAPVAPTPAAILTLEKAYQPQELERHWYQRWEEGGDFSPQGEGLAYCIMIPPPNVTGTLHMGHAFQDTLMDTLIRYHRMRGERVLWQAGTDHAGIATQMVVERQLAAQGQTRHDLGREAFIERVWQWKGESGGAITRQLRRLGASLDWSRERFTMDESLSQAVREVFVRLYEENLIYRGKRLVNWDPVLHTAVSDLEVISQEEDGHLWHIRYPLSDGSGHLVVATTRPETLLGDVAVAVHPHDSRYWLSIGKQIELPLTGRAIPVIVDEHVDAEFGTGCVKITPAHDFNDYAIGQRHTLPMINIFTADACINENGPSAYQGLNRYEARKRIVADLETLGLLEKVEPHKLMVPRGDRSHAVIEPYLTDQWFVRTGPLAAPAIAAVERGDIRFVPENWTRTYFDWMHKIEDWCISRQIWWGHRIPAWYDEDGNIYVARDEAQVRDKYGVPPDIALRQDDDVLDTWFSSALWPFSTLGWPEDTEALRTFYPTQVLVTGFDIIFFWVARMIMMGLKFTGQVPFREVYVTGLVRDTEGQKMSKSKGNVLDPIDLIDGIDLEALLAKRTAGLMQPEAAPKIEKATRKQFPEGMNAHGTDALRFTLASLASTGRDIKFDLGRLDGYRNFCNKLWNAARYVLMNTDGQDCGQGEGVVVFSLADRWIVSRLQVAEQTVAEALADYRFDLAAQAIYDFTWNEYCDWYLELSKPVLQDQSANPAALRATRRTLVRVLEALLRLTHPFMPFITEEIWQRVAPLAGKSGPTIMRQPYPQANPERIDLDSAVEMEWVMEIIVRVRQIRSGMNVAPGRLLPLLVQNTNEVDREMLQRNLGYLMSLARLESIEVLEPGAAAPQSATALSGDMTLLIPMAGVIDKDAELARLHREIDKLSKELEKAESKLANPSYVERAPAEVVGKERARVGELRAAIETLTEQRGRIGML